MQTTKAIRDLDDYTNELVQSYGFTRSRVNGVETLNVPPNLGSGQILYTSLSEDISMGIMDLELNRPIASYYEDYPCSCEVNYCLSGEIPYTETGVMKASLQKNQLGIYAVPHSRGMTMLPSGKRVLSIALMAENEFLKQLGLPGEAQGDALYQLMRPRRVSPKIHNYFDQILHNQMRGELKNTYIEALGKVLLAELWQEDPQLSGERQETGAGYSQFEQTALSQVREILRERYCSPPTIRELAQMTAINEYKLKNGFRSMFGKTVYEYIRYIRMEHAKYMLADPEISISEIAHRVGYINTSHFARAFRREHGMNPSHLRIGV